ncbi:hypothetical protein V6O07_18795, partial [Arthrospira platensis SPKY2]
GNFTSGSLSAIGNGPNTFCFPMATGPKPIFALRDKVDFQSGQYMVCGEDPAVSAVWIEGAPNAQQSSTTGYQFWIFDPNGTYSFRRFRSHNLSDNYASVGAT